MLGRPEAQSLMRRWYRKFSLEISQIPSQTVTLLTLKDPALHPTEYRGAPELQNEGRSGSILDRPT